LDGSQSNSPGSGSHKLSKGIIAAIAVVVTLVVVAIAFLISRVARRRYNSRMPRVNAKDVRPIPGYQNGKRTKSTQISV
jgi:hypothetical protein